LAIFLIFGPAEAITLSLNSTNQAISAGDTALIDLVISVLAPVDMQYILGAFLIDISFDETITISKNNQPIKIKL
jgi:hypothetical protein